MFAMSIIARGRQDMAKKGKALRPVNSTEVGGKQFRRIGSSRRINSFPAHPLVVVRDLRAGSVRSLDAYLKKHRGIPDKAVALELRKLLLGSAARSKFRLVVVDHPDGPHDRGSRPKSKSPVPNIREQKLAAAYREQFERIGKKRLAEEEAAKDTGESRSTVRRARKKVAASEDTQAEHARIEVRRKLALKALRQKSNT